LSIDPDEILGWFREQPPGTEVELNTLSERFGMRPEHLRDQLRRLVEQGALDQSEQVPGFADSNPSYQMTTTAS
jgi:DNA-binding IclR family transcriptional regulator